MLNDARKIRTLASIALYNYARDVIEGPYRLFACPPLADMLDAENMRISKVQRRQDGLLELFFQYSPTAESIQNDVLDAPITELKYKGSVCLDLSRDGAIKKVDLDSQCRLRGKSLKYNYNIEFVYSERSDSGSLSTIPISIKGEFADLKSGTIKVESFERGKVDEELFRLSHYGLPEPFEQKSQFPLARIGLFVGGILAMAVALWRMRS